MSKEKDRHSTFADGFREGYKAIMGDMVLVPLCVLVAT